MRWSIPLLLLCSACSGQVHTETTYDPGLVAQANVMSLIALGVVAIVAIVITICITITELRHH